MDWLKVRAKHIRIGIKIGSGKGEQKGVEEGRIMANLYISLKQLNELQLVHLPRAQKR